MKARKDEILRLGDLDRRTPLMRMTDDIKKFLADGMPLAEIREFCIVWHADMLIEDYEAAIKQAQAEIEAGR